MSAPRVFSLFVAYPSDKQASELLVNFQIQQLQGAQNYWISFIKPSWIHRSSDFNNFSTWLEIFCDYASYCRVEWLIWILLWTAYLLGRPSSSLQRPTYIYWTDVFLNFFIDQLSRILEIFSSLQDSTWRLSHQLSAHAGFFMSRRFICGAMMIQGCHFFHVLDNIDIPPNFQIIADKPDRWYLKFQDKDFYG